MNEGKTMRPANEPLAGVTRRTGTFFERLGIGRLAAAVILIVLGVVVLIMPRILELAVGITAIVLGILLLVEAGPRR